MENKNTYKKYNDYIKMLSENLGNDLSILKDYYHYNEKQTKEFINNLKKNRFFNAINILLTHNRSGNAKGLSMPMPSRTDADVEERSAEKCFISPYERFNCEQINIDGFITYDKIDTLAGTVDINFEQAFDDAMDKQKIISLLMVAFNGERLAKTSDKNAYPLAQDVHKGWPQKIRDNAPARVLSRPTIDENGDYKNIDAVVKAAIKKINDPIRMSAGLVAICGRNVLSDYPILNDNGDISENTDIILSTKLLGGLKAFIAPFFPENSILITELSNLSLYIENGTLRRIFNDNPRKNRLENMISMSIDFVVEDVQSAFLIDDIQF